MYLISSWGSSGSGKTTVALALASAFAKRNADVLLLSAEMRTPLLPVLLPSMKTVITRLYIRTLCQKARMKAILQNESGDFVADKGTVAVIIIVLGGIALALATTFLKDSLAPTLKEKLLAFFN